MKTWMLIYDDGDPVSSKRRLTIRTFTSGDEEQPLPGDLSAAVEDLAHDTDVSITLGAAEKLSVILVPLDGARTMAYRRGAWEPYAEGNVT